MKRVIAPLLVFFLVLMSLHGLLSCRAFKKTRARADSTITRSEHSQRSLDSQLFTEMIIEQEGDGIPVFTFPEILGIASAPGKGPSVDVPASRPSAAAPGSRPAGRYKSRVIFRQAQKHANQQVIVNEETKRFEARQFEKSRRPTAGSRLLSISLATIALLVVICILLRSKQRY